MGRIIKSFEPEKQVKQEQDKKLKGTFVSVLILGGILLVCWLTVFIIYMVRNGG